jgi:uncharacterized protein with HEPN domain
MREDDRVRLQHMADAAQSISRFISGRERTDLDSDEMLLFAVVRAIEIIGEAAVRVSDETRRTAADIPWLDIVGMRNRIVHAYWDVNRTIVWKAAAEEVPALLERLRSLPGLEGR